MSEATAREKHLHDLLMTVKVRLRHMETDFVTLRGMQEEARKIADQIAANIDRKGAGGIMARYKPGAHVYLIGDPIGVTLNGNGGTVVGPCPLWDGFCIVHMDRPAVYHGNLGKCEPCPDIREAYDNLAASRIGLLLTVARRRLISLPYRLRRGA